jgi:microcystin-dependent protein
VLSILDVLAAEPELGWLVARVKEINTTTKKLKLIVGDTGDTTALVVDKASYLASYTPAIGDIVHALIKEDRGVLVLGTTTGAGGGTPIGGIIAYGGTTAPSGWHLCDGSVHGSAALQSVLGTTTTPDLRDRFIVGAGSSYARGATGGAATVALTVANMPSHSHGGATVSASVSHQHTGTSDYMAENNVHNHSAWTGTDGAHGHNSAYGNNWQGSTQDQNPAGTDYGPIGWNAPNVGGTFGNGVHGHGVGVGDKDINHRHTFTTAASNPAHTHGINAEGSGTAHENRPPYYALVYIIKKS